MRVFVVGTGRCGSKTLAQALKKTVRNFTVGHESNVRFTGRRRLEYPDNHIELDHRLSFFLEELYSRHYDGAGRRPSPIIVHLRREREPTIASWARRFNIKGGMMPGWQHVAFFRPERGADYHREVAESYVDAVTSIIEMFFDVRQLATPNASSQLVELQIEEPLQLPRLWRLAGFEGDLRECERLVQEERVGVTS